MGGSAFPASSHGIPSWNKKKEEEEEGGGKEKALFPDNAPLPTNLPTLFFPELDTVVHREQAQPHITSVHLVMGCRDARAGVRILRKKKTSEQPYATKF